MFGTGGVFVPGDFREGDPGQIFNQMQSTYPPLNPSSTR